MTDITDIAGITTNDCWYYLILLLNWRICRYFWYSCWILKLRIRLMSICPYKSHCSDPNTGDEVATCLILSPSCHSRSWCPLRYLSSSHIASRLKHRVRQCPRNGWCSSCKFGVPPWKIGQVWCLFNGQSWGKNSTSGQTGQSPVVLAPVESLVYPQKKSLSPWHFDGKKDGLRNFISQIGPFTSHGPFFPIISCFPAYFPFRKGWSRRFRDWYFGFPLWWFPIPGRVWVSRNSVYNSRWRL